MGGAYPFNPMTAAAPYSVLVEATTSLAEKSPPSADDVGDDGAESPPAATASRRLPFPPSSAVERSPSPNVPSPKKVEAPVVSSTQPYFSIARPGSLRGSSQVLASIPQEEYTQAFSELRQFAEEFKTRRIRLGYTQGAVGQSLADRGYSNFAQSTISRFEQLQLSPTNAAAIKQILEKWLHEAESPLSSPSEGVVVGGAGGDVSIVGGCRKRKKRAVFTPQTKVTLEDHFAYNPRPNRATIEMLSGKLGLLPEEIRVWFCNKRQKTKQQDSFDHCGSSASGGNWYSKKVWSTSSSVGSGSTSPSQMSCSDGRSGNSPSPKTNFTIEELSKSSIVSTPVSGTLSPSLSSSFNISPTSVTSLGAFSSLPFFVPKFLVAPPATQAF